MISYRQTVAPTAYPVTIAEAKDHLRVDHGFEDYRIQRLIASATDEAEQHMKAPIVTQTWVQEMQAFRGLEIELAVYPVQSISSITYIDPDDTQQTLSTSVYDLDVGHNPSFIYLKHDQSWPSVRGARNDITITMVCGFDPIPEAIKQAILVAVGEAYENRENSVTGTIYSRVGAVERLLGKYRNTRL